MSLPPSSRDYEGQLLCYKPCYGWGWSVLNTSEADANVDYAQVDRAGAFHIRVHRFFSFKGELRGIVGRVEQTGHMFDGLWTTTWTMIVGDFDLTNNLCGRWDIHLGPCAPSGEDWPEMPDTSPVYNGYGVLAVSHSATAQESEGPK